jgi:signal transduction histidine kinase
MLKSLIKSRGVSNIYQKKTAVKVAVISVALIIGAASIYYTDILIGKLKDREERFISLYASALEFVGNEQNSGNLNFLTQEIIVPNNVIPVILTDVDRNPLQFRNINLKKNLGEKERTEALKAELLLMEEQHEPISITRKDERGRVEIIQWVYYKNSQLLTQLKFYPYVQLSVIAGFILLAYLIFNYSRAVEQDRVWIGMAKETAHQLGTPLSSLMAWIEYFRADPAINPEITAEIDKDVQRLGMITARFSSIGSVPTLKKENMYQVLQSTTAYLQKRISSKVKMMVSTDHSDLCVNINRPLFEWVIENICKNAVDAMSGKGTITLRSGNKDGKVYIDITDSGKGIPKSKISQVFTPGYTTKKRGWGLGLSLTKRIIEKYHKGKIFVKESEIDAGTTFRILLNP